MKVRFSDAMAHVQEAVEEYGYYKTAAMIGGMFLAVESVSDERLLRRMLANLAADYMSQIDANVPEWLDTMNGAIGAHDALKGE